MAAEFRLSQISQLKLVSIYFFVGEAPVHVSVVDAVAERLLACLGVNKIVDLND